MGTTLCAQQALNDFFPMEVGRTFTYSFQSFEKHWSSLIPLYSVRDSGIVRFSISDLVEDDTVKTWKIDSRSSLQRTIKVITQWWDTTRKDTVYDFEGARSLIIIERKYGSHALTSSELYTTANEFRIWEFPRRLRGWYDALLSVGDTVYRFSEHTFSRTEVQVFSVSILMIADTIEFRQDVGLYTVNAFSDKGPSTPYRYEWQARLIDPVVSVEPVVTRLNGPVVLGQNYPNPFSQTTTFTVHSTGEAVTLRILDLYGRICDDILNGITLPGGTQFVTIDASKYPSGIYYAQIISGGCVQMRKFVVTRAR